MLGPAEYARCEHVRQSLDTSETFRCRRLGAPDLRRLGPALGERDFLLWWLALLGMDLALQMVEVAIGWEVYSLHGSALDLGWIGLAEFIPLFVFALPFGQLADRFPRRLIFAAALVIGAGVGGGLAAVSSAGVTEVWPYLALAVLAGTSMALGLPAARAMPPTLVGPELLQSAMNLRSIATQAGTVIGPALGGFLYAVSPTFVYLLAAGVCLVSAVCAAAISPRAGAGAEEGQLPAVIEEETAPGPASMEGVLEGLRFVGRTQILLGAILLDLLAVLFGGAVALLPVFAKSILHVGPTGLGVLRAAPAIGALLGAAYITRRPIRGRAGRTLLIAVGLYGVIDDRVRPVARVRDLAAGADRQRLRRPLQHEHPRDHGRAGDPGPPARPRQRCRDGVHQRLQSARRVRVRAGRVPGRHRAGGRRRRRDHDSAGARPGDGCSRRSPTSIGSRTFDQPSRTGRLPA